MRRLELLIAPLLAGCSLDTNPLLVSLFGPPKVSQSETWSGAGSARFDHSVLDALLATHVDEGWVDYASLAEQEGALQTYLEAVSEAPFQELGRDGKLALLINAYNAATLALIVEHYPLESIKDIPSAQRWDAQRWQVMGRALSLNQLEHEVIRANFAEPRIHFALVCAAVGCPPLRSEAYTAERLEAQLSDQAHRVHTGARWFRYTPDQLSLTRLYLWYEDDFEQAAGSVLAYAARFSAELAADLAREDPPPIQWLPYDWSLNDQAARPAR